MNHASFPKLTATLPGQGVRAKVWVVGRPKSTPGCGWNPIQQSIGRTRNKGNRARTPSMSRASTTRFQSVSISLKAIQGMCFTRRFLWRNVVIGPYISSVDVRKTAMGYQMSR